MAELDARRAEVLGHAARVIQRQIRTHMARKEFVAYRVAAIHLQSYLRGIRCKRYGYGVYFPFINTTVAHESCGKQIILVLPLLLFTKCIWC